MAYHDEPINRAATSEAVTKSPAVASERTILILISGCIFMAVLNTSMFNVALPAIDREFAVGSARLGWIVTVYSLFFGISTPFYGRLADLYGLRRFLTIGMVIFVVGSLAAAIAPTYWLLIVARAFQAIGTAAIPSLGMATIIRVFPAERRGAATGMIAAVVGAGAALGPSLGGAVTQFASWRFLFLISAILIVAIPIVRRILPPDSPPRQGSLDLPGGLMLAATIALLLLAVTNVSGQGILSPRVMGFLGLALLTLGLLIWRIRTAASPFIEPELLRNRNYMKLSGAAFLLMTANMGTLVLIPLLLDRVNGLPAAQIGLVMLPQAAMMAMLGPIGGRLADRIGSAIPMRIGVILSFTGFFLLTSIGAGSSALTIAAILLITGAGMGMTNSTMINSTSLVLPPERVGLGVGLFNMNFFLGGAFGATITTTILEARETIPDALNPLHTGLAPGFSDALLAPLSVVIIASMLIWLVRVPRPVQR